MKKTVRCLNCNKVVRRYGSFTVELEEAEVIGGVPTGRLIKKVGRLCRRCTHGAGYNPKGSEKDVDVV